MNEFFTIGRPFANSRFFDGQLDEVRIADTDRGLDWICAEYNNQNNPGSWLTFTNVAPVLGSMEIPALNFTEDGTPIIITAGTTITDENDGYMNGGTIEFTANYSSTEDVLAFTDANGITGSWNAGTGILTLSGTATSANYQTALRSVTYQNTNTANPSIAVRTVAFTVTDFNGALSNTVSRNIGVTRVNDAPVLANTEATALAYAEGQIATIVTPLTTVADVDNTNLACSVSISPDTSIPKMCWRSRIRPTLPERGLLLPAYSHLQERQRWRTIKALFSPLPTRTLTIAFHQLLPVPLASR